MTPSPPSSGISTSAVIVCERFLTLMKAFSVMWVMPGYTVNEVRSPIRSGLPAIEALKRSTVRSSSGRTSYLIASAMKRSCNSASLGMTAPKGPGYCGVFDSSPGFVHSVNALPRLFVVITMFAAKNFQQVTETSSTDFELFIHK